jgi:hypothetical protein
VDILIGLLFLVLGIALATAGIRYWFILLPVLGFLAGLSMGVAIMHWAFDEGFFSTGAGLVIGFFIGIVFAVLSYLFWYVGALMGAAFLGATVGAGLMRALSVNTEWLIFIVSILVGFAFVYITAMLWLPLYMVIVNTAFAGVTWAISGVMLVFGVLDRGDLSYGTVTAAINESWFWVIVWIVAAIAAIVAQLRMVADVVLPEDKYSRAVMPSGASTGPA